MCKIETERQDECHVYAITFLDHPCYKPNMQRSPLRFAPALLVVILTALCLVMPNNHAQAQTPEPTPEPTPAYQYGMTLTSGAEVLVVRSVTYGDIAIIVMVLVVVILFVFYIVLRSTKLWTAR